MTFDISHSGADPDKAKTLTCLFSVQTILSIYNRSILQKNIDPLVQEQVPECDRAEDQGLQPGHEQRSGQALADDVAGDDDDDDDYDDDYDVVAAEDDQ